MSAIACGTADLFEPFVNVERNLKGVRYFF